MRVAIVVVVVAALIGGCSSERRTGEGLAESVPHGTNDRACVMRAGGQDVLQVWMPAGAECTSSEGQLHTKAHDRYVDFWLVPHAGTVKEASPHVDSVIATQFTDFKSTSTTTLTVAGSPALRMYGEGEEADDGDPAHADVVVFALNGRVFVACAHGESLSDKDRAWLMEVVRSVAAP